MNRETLFADILIPLPVPGYFTYRIPLHLADQVAVGKRAAVQFGIRKIVTGLIRRIHDQIPSGNNVKYLLNVLDDEPIIQPIQFSFWEWIAHYYMCRPGEVMNAALPSALKLSSETSLVANPDFDKNTDLLTDKEFLIYEALQIQERITLSEAAKIVDIAKIHPLFRTLIEKRVVLPEEELRDPYRPKRVEYLFFAEAYLTHKKMEEAMNALEKRAPKQLELLLALIQLTGYFSKAPTPVPKTTLFEKVGKSAPQSLKTLEKKGIITIRQQIVSRLPRERASARVEEIILSEAQQTAFDQVGHHLAQGIPVLLHGVTGSGKTEIYIKHIHRILQKGRQVLFLLPEVALTTQIILRLQKYFGEKIGVYHSRYNLHERAEIWRRVQSQEEGNRYEIILGTRSALFLPFPRLGLIIVDEAHDYSYKQTTPAPRYNARDAAIWLAHKQGAEVLLGSATPSLESFFNCRSGKYALVELKERYGGAQLPEILIADLRKAHRTKEMNGLFSQFLLQHIEEALKQREQVILFQNKRGFSRRLECDLCGYAPQCIHCDVVLIHHKHFNQMRCHYCGYHIKIPSHCPECGSPSISMKGFGTEKIEETLSEIFPTHRIARMDLDTTRSKNAYQRIISDFEAQKIDILVGTQMVTKGLDFGNVSLVGVISAESLINFPDFRSFERSFQLMAQVSGRAGRKKKPGKVIIQTFDPNHPVIRYVANHDYEGMYTLQIQERHQYNYPPFYRIIQLNLQHKEPAILNEAADKLAQLLRHPFPQQVLGPEYPIVPRVRNRYIKQIIIKLKRGPKFAQQHETIQSLLHNFEADRRYKSVQVNIDVDPY
ncbi:MAG: primosomal protein N' [Bacteroidetes bacterium]|nr:MAG: primosomal protein N' [Bacteroidota bacterium]PIE88417.1 MAG: primosomal protein N' [Bacteroidota bacterium]